jgi:peptide/nickel transport system permease protein
MGPGVSLARPAPWLPSERRKVGAYLARRALLALVVLFGVSIVVFVIVRVIPGDPVQLMYPEGMPPELLKRVRGEMGLDDPVYVQYLAFLRQTLQGNLGESYRYHRPVTELVLERLPATAELTLAALAISLILGIPMGIVAALKRNSALDNVVMLVGMFGQSMPTFWLGIMLIIAFAVSLNWFPTSGREGARYVVLPALTLAGFYVALTARLVRSCMLEVISQDYVRTARAKGLSEHGVIIGHALRNALIPVVTVLGMQVGALLGGAVITESVFAWPGIGFLSITAIWQRDYNIVQAVVLLSAVVFVLLNLLVDVVYAWLDPRIRLTG